jgi:hypothetical protein
MASMDPPRVQAAPNASRIRGTVTGVRPHPAGAGTVWEVAVDKVDSVAGLANLAGRHEGGIIEIQVHPEAPVDVQPRDKIEAQVTYVGDERGGAFFLQENDIRRI